MNAGCEKGCFHRDLEGIRLMDAISKIGGLCLGKKKTAKNEKRSEKYGTWQRLSRVRRRMDLILQWNQATLRQEGHSTAWTAIARPRHNSYGNGYRH